MQGHPSVDSWKCVSGISSTSPCCFTSMTFAYSWKQPIKCWTVLSSCFSRLKEFNLKIKPKKSYFFQTSVTFLGHILSADGISPNPEKVAKIKDWPIPKTPKEVHSFVGLPHITIASYQISQNGQGCPNRPCFL